MSNNYNKIMDEELIEKIARALCAEEGIPEDLDDGYNGWRRFNSHAKIVLSIIYNLPASVRSGKFKLDLSDKFYDKAKNEAEVEIGALNPEWLPSTSSTVSGS